MLLKTLVLTAALAVPAAALDYLPLWPGPAPGAPQPPAGSEKSDGGRFTEVEVPQFVLYRPAKPNGTTVVVMPGGGYAFTSFSNEGWPVGEWLAAHGVTAMVLKYRTSAADKLGYFFPVPLLDARRAIRTARANAAAWATDPQKVGVMGFSAGGHLASMAATLHAEKFPVESADAVDSLSARPDFAIMVYPVISMGKPYTHGGSVQRLLGPQASDADKAKLNTAERVDATTPPCLLIHAADDAAVPLQNSLDFVAACTRNKVPVSAHLFTSGGHGFGAKGRAEAAGWMDGQLAPWLERNGWIPR
jgi:acetyl esterase/lipase